MEDLLKFAIFAAQDAGANWAEARYASEDVTSFYYDNDVPVSSYYTLDNSIFIRFIVNNSVGSVFIPEPTKEKISSMIKKQVKVAKAASRINQEKLLFSEEKAYTKKYSVKEKTKLNSISDKEKSKTILNAYKSLSKVESFDSSSIGLNTKITDKYYMNSDGALIISKIPEITMNYFFTVKSNGKTTQRMNYLAGRGGWETVKNWNLNKSLVHEAKNLTNVLNKGVSAPKGVMDFVVGHEVTGIMVHESVGHPYEADRIMGRESAQAGESFVKMDMVGRRVGSDYVNIIDTPLMDNSAAYYLYDEEGVKSRDKLLMKKGLINEFMHDRSSSAKMGLTSNASSRISDNSKEPLIRMSNTYVVPGKATEASLIKDVKKGIYMKNFMEWNIDDTRYNFKAKGNEAYLIENGELTKPVLFPNLEIDTYKMWSSVDGVGNKASFGMVGGPCGKGEPMQGVPTSMGGPSLLLRGINL